MLQLIQWYDQVLNSISIRGAQKHFCPLGGLDKKIIENHWFTPNYQLVQDVVIGYIKSASKATQYIK